MKKLTSYLSSDYIASANKLKPNGARKKIIAYVESYDDIAFWRGVLDEFETEKLYFEIMLPCRSTLGKGKKAAMAHKLGPCMIACVDSDYDWLMQGSTPVSEEVCNNPYVLHTYVYAIENYFCYAPSLHQSVVLSTLNDYEDLDFVAFMEEYSTIIWPLFVWNIWCYHNGYGGEFGIMELAQVVTFHDIDFRNPQNALEDLRRRVNKKIAYFQHHYPKAKKSYAPLRDKLLEMGLTPETTYLYIQGHSLMDGVVLPLLTPICTHLRKYREREINNLAVHDTQKQNEFSCYQHSQCPIEVALKKSSGYKRSFPFKLLKADIEKLLDSSTAPTQGCPLPQSSSVSQG